MPACLSTTLWEVPSITPTHSSSLRNTLLAAIHCLSRFCSPFWPHNRRSPSARARERGILSAKHATHQLRTTSTPWFDSGARGKGPSCGSYRRLVVLCGTLKAHSLRYTAFCVFCCTNLENVLGLSRTLVFVGRPPSFVLQMEHSV